MRELMDVDGLSSFAVTGYSLGGNLALKLAGDFGSHAPKELCGVCAVSPTMDLAVCVEALERPSNRIYQRHFVRNLKKRMGRKIRTFPERFSSAALPGIRTIRQFDEAYTAPFHGFTGASDYYERASAMRVIDRIRVPTLIISAADDPFVPPAPFGNPAVLRNRHITVVLTDHGGHCGFVEEASGAYDGYWAEREVVDFLIRCRTAR
jgi:predicted alpha/beta-fold hydrolase